jgi:hypothetical protein
MITLLPILAQPLASDHLWPVLLFLLTLALMASLKTLGNRIAGWQHTRCHLHELSHRLHELITHKHH